MFDTEVYKTEPLREEHFDPAHPSVIKPYGRSATKNIIVFLLLYAAIKTPLEWFFDRKPPHSLFIAVPIFLVIVPIAQFITKQIVLKNRSISHSLRDLLLKEEALNKPIFLNQFAPLLNHFGHLEIIHPDIPSRWTDEEITYDQIIKATIPPAKWLLVRSFNYFLVPVILIAFVFGSIWVTFGTLKALPFPIVLTTWALLTAMGLSISNQAFRTFQDTEAIKEDPTRIPTAISYLQKLQSYPTDFEIGIPFINRWFAERRLRQLQTLK
jgi:membrane protein YdbS with pleckstrin-like domain